MAVRRHGRHSTSNFWEGALPRTALPGSESAGAIVEKRWIARLRQRPATCHQSGSHNMTATARAAAIIPDTAASTKGPPNGVPIADSLPHVAANLLGESA